MHNNITNIDVIFFDLDGTLIDDETSTLNALTRTCQDIAEHDDIDISTLVSRVKFYSEQLLLSSAYSDYCQKIGIGSLEALWGRFEDQSGRMHGMKRWVSEFQIRSWELALYDLGPRIKGLAEHLSTRFSSERRLDQAVYPDASRTLEDLSERYSLGLITNGAADIQGEKLRISGLKKYFNTIVISGDLGKGKPEKEIFQHALDQAASSADRCIMVGDNLVKDIQGASDAGITPIWINRKNAGRPMSELQDFEVTALTDVMDKVTDPSHV